MTLLRENGGAASNCECFRCRVGREARKSEPFAAGPIVSVVLAVAADLVAREGDTTGSNE